MMKENWNFLKIDIKSKTPSKLPSQVHNCPKKKSQEFQWNLFLNGLYYKMFMIKSLTWGENKRRNKQARRRNVIPILRFFYYNFQIFFLVLFIPIMYYRIKFLSFHKLFMWLFNISLFVCLSYTAQNIFCLFAKSFKWA